MEHNSGLDQVEGAPSPGKGCFLLRADCPLVVFSGSCDDTALKGGCSGAGTLWSFSSVWLPWDPQRVEKLLPRSPLKGEPFFYAQHGKCWIFKDINFFWFPWDIIMGNKLSNRLKMHGEASWRRGWGKSERPEMQSTQSSSRLSIEPPEILRNSLL